MKKQLLLLLCLLSFSIIQAQTFNDGVLEYTVISGTNVSVKKYNNVCPTGNLIIPNTVTDNSITYTITEIESNAFNACSGLTSLNIPNSVTSIGAQAFNACSGLTSLSIPNSVTSIESAAFRNCSGLTSLSIPNSVTSIVSATFAHCSGLTSLSMPNSITSIGNSAFYYCSGLTSLSIPNSVASIEGYAFAYCSGLTSLSIPNSVASIGNNAFDNCNGLTNVTVDWAIPLVVPTDVFQNVNVNAIPLTVPSGTVALYQAATVWQDFDFSALSTENYTENDIDVELFPNPVKDQLNIDINNNLTLRQIRIFNHLGQLIKQSKSPIIYVSDLKGVYYAQISTNKGNVTKKIIVE